MSQRSTLTQYLIEQRRRYPEASGRFNNLILDVALSCKAIARAVALGCLGDMHGHHLHNDVVSVQVQGKVQHKLDVYANQTFIDMTSGNGQLAGMASEEMHAPWPVPASRVAPRVPAASSPATSPPQARCYPLLRGEGWVRGNCRY